MIHYHGTPITPRAKMLSLAGRNFCVSFAVPRDVQVCHEIGQSVLLDNGAFSAWRRGYVPDWLDYYNWVAPWLEHWTTWAVIPDVIDGSEAENDALLAKWPFGSRGAPVWHMHESLERLRRLAAEWPRVCVGSSGQYATLGDDRWHDRMRETMNEVCGDGPAPTWLHMLRGLALAGSEYPFASADSTNLAQTHNGNPRRGEAPKSLVAMADRIDARQCQPRWRSVAEQLVLE